MTTCYVLIKETNLDPVGGKKQADSLRAAKTVNVFSDFENAKQQMRTILKEYATKKSDLFDGNGNILHLDDFLNDCLFDEDMDMEETDISNPLPEILKSYFLNEEPDDIETFDMYAKYGIIIDADFGVMQLSGDSKYENHISGIDWYNIPTPNSEYEITPIHIAINSFYMDDPEKTYVCRIEGQFEEWDNPFFLYLELRKVDIE